MLVYCRRRTRDTVLKKGRALLQGRRPPTNCVPSLCVGARWGRISRPLWMRFLLPQGDL